MDFVSPVPFHDHTMIALTVIFFIALVLLMIPARQRKRKNDER